MAIKRVIDMNVQEGDEIEVQVESGGYTVGEVVAVSDSIVDRTPGALIDLTYGSGRRRVTEDQIERVLGN